MEKKNFTLSALISVLILLSGETVFAQMYWNNACSFAGSSSSFVSRGNSSSLNISGSFTIEAWVCPVNATSPVNQILVQKREGGNANGYTLYLSSGKVTIRTNATTRLIGKSVIQNNVWTHIAGTYNSANGNFSIYINGSPDTNVIIAGAAPSAATDSLFIGKGFNSPYSGLMDELRIWSRDLNSTQLTQQRRTSLGTNSGKYEGLELSLTFQDNDGSGIPFSLSDWSGNNNTCLNKGVTGEDFSNRPSLTIALNDCIELNGTDEYLACPDSPTLSPASEITLEAWIYPRTTDKKNMIIQKGSPDGKIADYNLSLVNGSLNASINNVSSLTSDDIIPLNRWSHVAFTYDGPNGVFSFYINGELTDAGIFDKGFIIDGSDSLYIGGSTESTDFDGYIDEVRISNTAKSGNEINSYLFRSIDESNDGPATEAVYNFDGYAVSNVGVLNRIYFRNNATFSYCGVKNNTPVSPLDRDDAQNFHDGFYLRSSDRRIPETGQSGLMKDDSIEIYVDEIITDVNVFVAINHNLEQDLEISLIAPNGEIVSLLNDNTLTTNSDNMITIFNDDADSSLVNGRYVSFGPSIRPLNNMNSVFSGDNSSGTWIIRVNDDAASAGDTGRLYAWGIQFNNASAKSSQLASNVLIQGFYNQATNLMVRDTMRFVLRYISFPYDAADTGKAYLNTDGSGVALFDNAESGILYNIQLLHRNSIETWNSSVISFDALTAQANFDFTLSMTQAYGNNMIQVDSVPVEFAVYSGDVNQDGFVNLSDILLTYNDANSFVAGYVKTDLNGDNISDLSDVLIAYNNSANFVAKMIPE